MPKRPTHSGPDLASLRAIVLPIARAHGARNIRIFGSFARGQQRPTSDLDLLVQLPRQASLLDLVALKLDLQDALGRKVDVLTEGGINRHLRRGILREARPL